MKVGEDHSIAILAVGVPVPAPDEAVVSPVCCGICGTDLHIVRHGFPGTRYPVIPGHEFAGHVTAVGADVRNIKEGDFVAVSARKAYRVPESIGHSVATLIEPLA